MDDSTLQFSLRHTVKLTTNIYKCTCIWDVNSASLDLYMLTNYILFANKKRVFKLLIRIIVLLLYIRGHVRGVIMNLHSFSSAIYLILLHTATYFKLYNPSFLVEIEIEICCLTLHATIFQLYMWRHIDVQADWRRSWTYGRASNTIDTS